MRKMGLKGEQLNLGANLVVKGLLQRSREGAEESQLEELVSKVCSERVLV